MSPPFHLRLSISVSPLSSVYLHVPVCAISDPESPLKPKSPAPSPPTRRRRQHRALARDLRHRRRPPRVPPPRPVDPFRVLSKQQAPRRVSRRSVRRHRCARQRHRDAGSCAEAGARTSAGGAGVPLPPHLLAAWSLRAQRRRSRLWWSEDRSW